MSHELRTPLNSLLILAKLLADNDNGRLSEEQVRYAQTIQSSGNDLLTLINDILDLSKIEAGHMEIKPEPLALARLTRDLSNLFAPVAEKKNLEFRIEIDARNAQAISRPTGKDSSRFCGTCFRTHSSSPNRAKWS